jgi:putative membrane protein insertion efficiency factor
MKTVLRWIIQFYRLMISPLLGPRCRFYPTCSQYALEALEQHNVARASLLIGKRLARCHPWGGSGYDPVPPASSQGTDDKTDDQRPPPAAKSALGLRIARQSCDCQQHVAARSTLCHSNRHFTPYTSQPRQAHQGLSPLMNPTGLPFS